MAAGEEIDLNGLDSLLKSVESTIKGLNTELGRTEKRVKNINGKEISEFRSSLQNLEKTIFDLKYKVKDGEVGMLDFVSVFKKMRTELNNMGSSNLPITGLIETVGKLKEMTSSLSAKMIAEPYKEAYSSIKEGVVSLFGKIQQYIKSTQQAVQATEQQATAQQNVANAAANTANAQQRAAQSVQQQAKQLNAQKLHVGSITAAMQRTQQLIMQGNTQMISSYLKQEMSISRLNNALIGLRNAQQNVNLATEKGRKEYWRIEAEIKQIEKTLARVNGEQGALNGIITKMKSGLGQVAMAAGVMGGIFGAVNFFRNLYKITSEFQLQQRALEAIINNAREANILFKQMQQLAVNSPLKLMDLNKYTKQLAAYRIETRNLYDSLKMLGDISVGVGVDMNRLILAYGQVKAANYLRGQELRQFSEAGVNILGGLQEYYKETKNISMSINEIFDSVSKRKVLFEDVDAVLHNMTQSGGAFFNMQLIQSQTLYGQYQKLGDLFQINMNKIGQSTSGILMGFLKLLQLVLSNIRPIVSLISGIVVGKGIYALYNSLYRANLVSDRLKLSLKGASMNMKTLALWGRMVERIQFVKLARSIRMAAASATALGMALRGVAAGAAAIAISALFNAFQNHKQKAKELSEELLELNRRFSDIREITNDFDRATSFKAQRIELQRLVEKAKEYRYNLTLPAKITPENINQAFKDATEQLSHYIKMTQYYSSRFNTNMLENRVANLNETLSDYSVAQKNANDLYEKYLNEFDNLTQEEQDIILRLQEKREAYRTNEKEASEKYGEDRAAFERNFVREIAKIRRGYLVGNEIYDSVSDWRTYTEALDNVDQFEKEYEAKLDKAFKSIARRAKLKNLATQFIGLEGKDLENKIIKEIPPIVNSLSQLGDFAKSDIIRKISEALNLDYSTVATTYIKYENGNSDIGDDEFKRLMKDFIANDKVMDKDLVIKVKFELPEDVNLSEAAEKAISDVYDIDFKKGVDVNLAKDIDDEISRIFLSGKSIDEIKKDADELFKTYTDGLKDYRRVATYTGKDAETALESANQQNSRSFEKAAQGVQYYTLALEKLGRMYKVNVWDKPKTKSGGRGKSFVEEYQSMIDYVKKLNQEYEKLRQNFSEKTSYDEIIKNFKESFADMPQEFKEKFGELQNIIFNSKLGTAEGEKLVKEIIEASETLNPDEIAKLRRNVQQYIDQLEAEFNVEVKIKDDERLKAQVQKMFDDYNLTIELDKLGVDADEVGKLFNIDTKDLLTLENKLESMKEEFVGRNMEKEYRQFMRKIVEINDKANLEMAKKYVKYLREEYGERAKVELEYMRQRAEVYALPFDKDETMRILDNLQKETQKKLDELDWKTFTGSDMYIEVFEDLERVSNKAIDSMLKHLEELKSSLKSLSPTELKTITDQMQKLRDEMIRRDPFKAMADSLKSLRAEKKNRETTGTLINEVLGREDGTPIKNFRKTLNQAVDAARDIQYQAKEKVNLAETLLGAGEQRDSDIEWLKKNAADWDWADDYYNVDSMEEALKQIKANRDKFRDLVNVDKLKGITSEEGLSEDEKSYLIYQNMADRVSSLVSALKKLDEYGEKDTTAENLSSDLKFASESMKEATDNANKLGDTKKRIEDWWKALKAAGELLGDWTQKAKQSFDDVYEGLESLGIGTDTIGQAWKEFGDQMFDTISRALQMIPSMVSSIVAAETAINAAAGWIGLIAEAITLIMSGIKALAGLHDSFKQAEIEKLQKSLDKLEKNAEDLSNAFNDLYDEDRMRVFDAALIRTRELAIKTLEDMKRAEAAKKKSDQTVIDDYQNQIDNLNKEIQEGIENFYEALGGFGSAANMKSTVEQWTDAWYEAFKETGDGLSGLEDSFEEFFENVVKKHLMNNIMAKYFGEDFLSGLDKILGTEGGVMGNLDALNDWINQYHELAVQADAEMQAATQTLQNVTGVGAGLSGLQASIQGMTEETASALEGYLNSVRMYVADNNQILRNIYTGLAIDSNSNPILSQLKIVAANTNAISTMFSDIYKGAGHDDGGAYIKVRMG